MPLTYCGTATLRDASRDSVESFITDLAERAAKDRDGLLCKLNSYAKPQEVQPMKRHIPGLHGEVTQHGDDILEGVFLVRVDRVFYRWHPADDRSTSCGSPFSNPKNIRAVPSPAGSTARPKPCGNSAGSCATSATTPICWAETKSMKRPCSACAASSDLPHHPERPPLSQPRRIRSCR